MASTASGRVAVISWLIVKSRRLTEGLHDPFEIVLVLGPDVFFDQLEPGLYVVVAWI